MSGELSFIEFGVADAGRGRDFYTALFGWAFEPGPSGGDGFTVAGINTPAGLHGEDPAAAPILFFHVDDVVAAAARVIELGGSVDESDVTGDDASAAKFGLFRLCRDNQGSPFGLHQLPRES